MPYDVARLKTVTIGGAPMSLGEAIALAIGHARPIIIDEAATDPAMATHLAHADTIIDAATWNPQDLNAVAEVVALGADYMHNNDYANDHDFPDDAAAAAFLDYGDRARSLLLDLARSVDQP